MTRNGTGTSAIISDIDGTLLTTGSAGAMAWSRAVQEQYRVPANIDDCTEAGMPTRRLAG